MTRTRYNISTPPFSKSAGGTTRITSWLGPGSATFTPRENFMSAPNIAKGDMVTSIARSTVRGAIGWLNSSVGGESTSIRIRRGEGGVGSEPGERVVVAMLLASIDLFFDFPEGPTRLADPFLASRVLMQHIAVFEPYKNNTTKVEKPYFSTPCTPRNPTKE